jgi:ribosomal protein S12 methylthiotransferase
VPQSTPRARVYFRSLGCPKNQVDSEVMLGALALSGYAIAERLEDADVAVVNTCSFIESAREESLDAILEVAEQRERGRLRGLVVAGCLPQRYGAALARELPEVDAFVGTAAFPGIAAILDEALGGRRGGVYVDAGRTHLASERDPRLLIGPRHSAWLKLAEGCDRACAFCAIPAIRGRFQSRTLDSLVREAALLAGEGVRELGLVSQDTCAWGKDLPGRPRLPDLVRALDGVAGLDWIRLHYLYPSGIGDDLLDAIAGARRVLPYLDVPLQHASDRVLRAMRRGVGARRQADLVRRVRERIPGVTLRTTFIVGFPGESDADFEALLGFVRDARFDRVGVFRYSDEEGTAAAGHADKVPAAVARRRFRALVALAREIARAKLEKLVGAEASVLVDRAAGGRAAGRLASQAPEVDGRVILSGAARAGEMVRARITRAREPDLEAEVVARELGCAA